MRQPGKIAAVEAARAARRAAQLVREAHERAESEEKSIELHSAKSTPKRRKSSESYSFTSEEISKLRDERGLSWRQVAINLDLGSPSSARSAYTTLTGRHHSESGTVVRRSRAGSLGTAKASTRKVYAPEWNDESDQDEIIDRMTNSRTLIGRTLGGVYLEEEILVGRVKRLTWDGKDEHLCVHFIDKTTGGTRSVLVSHIKEVR